jgi:hypothetical protein
MALVLYVLYIVPLTRGRGHEVAVLPAWLPDPRLRIVVNGFVYERAAGVEGKELSGRRSSVVDGSFHTYVASNTSSALALVHATPHFDVLYMYTNSILSLPHIHQLVVVTFALRLSRNHSQFRRPRGQRPLEGIKPTVLRIRFCSQLFLQPNTSCGTRSCSASAFFLQLVGTPDS